MSIDTTIKILAAITGLLVGFYWRRVYRRYKEWRFGRNGFKKGDKIICTIIGADGEHKYVGLIKKVKKTTITFNELQGITEQGYLDKESGNLKAQRDRK